MILSKGEILRAGAVSGVAGDIQFQPAGADLTLRAVYGFDSAGSVDFDNSERVLPATNELRFGADGWIWLHKGAYKISYNETVKIPADCAGFGFPRSSLLRCGADIHCAVWDPGYEGKSESLLVVSNERGIKLKRGARVMQLVLARIGAPSGEVYSGAYHKENL
jgi:dUTP pyrophosphatase